MSCFPSRGKSPFPFVLHTAPSDHAVCRALIALLSAWDVEMPFHLAIVLTAEAMVSSPIPPNPIRLRVDQPVWLVWSVQPGSSLVRVLAVRRLVWWPLDPRDWRMDTRED